jgi:hypothetical protein
MESTPMTECRAELSPAHQDLMLVSGWRVRGYVVQDAPLLSLFGIMKRVTLNFKERGRNDNAE